MADSDYLREQIKSIQKGRLEKQSTALITEERAQKFDLFIHLISNLKQSLIICGPKGIGKTTLLTAFTELKAESRPVIVLQATEQLNVESIQEQLWGILRRQKPETGGPDLIQQLQQLERLNRRVVLIIDDAGKLAAGLMTNLMRYATMYPCLRLVFALRTEELQQKRNTDRTVGECHFIEIPPLSLSQCREYLLDLVNKPDNKPFIDSMEADNKLIVDRAIDDVMVKRIYNKTHGIPGKIVEELPNCLNANAMKGVGWIYILVFACLITLSIGALLWRNVGTETEKNTLNGVSQVNSGTVVAPLSIPGQVPAQPEVAPLAQVNKKSTSMPVIPDAGKSKPDYYPGYARVREKDALDEYQANKDGALIQEVASEQPKVEIIPLEPPPAPALAPQPVPVIIETHEPAVPALAKIESELKVKDEVEPTKLKINPKLTADTKVIPNVKEVVKLGIKENQKPPVKAVNKMEPIKRVIPEVKQPVFSKPKLEEVKQVTLDPSTLRVVKEHPEQAVKIVSFEKPKSIPVNVPKSDPIASEQTKPERVQADLAEPAIPADVEKLPLETIKPNKPVTAEKTEQPAGLARLGVVMKYKSDVVKPSKQQPDIQAPVKPETVKPAAIEQTKALITSGTGPVKNAKPENETVDSAPNKSSGGNYTLQAMVFTQQQTLQNFMRRHGSLAPNLRYTTTNKDGSEKYVVTYGSFSSIAEANAAKQKLPADFKQAYARKR